MSKRGTEELLMKRGGWVWWGSGCDGGEFTSSDVSTGISGELRTEPERWKVENAEIFGKLKRQEDGYEYEKKKVEEERHRGETPRRGDGQRLLKADLRPRGDRGYGYSPEQIQRAWTSRRPHGNFCRLVVQPSCLDPVFACEEETIPCDVLWPRLLPFRLLLPYSSIGHSRTCRRVHRKCGLPLARFLFSRTEGAVDCTVPVPGFGERQETNRWGGVLPPTRSEKGKFCIYSNTGKCKIVLQFVNQIFSSNLFRLQKPYSVLYMCIIS